MLYHYELKIYHFRGLSFLLQHFFRECPIDLKEAISSICFAAPRCADLPELQQVQMFFAAKYGKEFVTAATELLPDCGVNRQIIELLSIRAPKVETKLKLLKEIAEEHEIDWDPSATETEFLKPHEDLLNGPSHFTNGSTLPLPPQKHDALSSDHMDQSHVEPDSDADSDSLDLPEVPKDSVRPPLDVSSASGNVTNLPFSTQDLGVNDLEANKSTPNEDLPHISYMDPSIASTDNHPLVENKQFLPFVSPPSFPSFPVSAKKNELAPQSIPSVSEYLNPSHASASPPPSSTTVTFPKEIEPDLSPSSLSSFPENLDKNELASSAKHSEQVSSTSLPASKNELAASISWTKSEIHADLQDVLAAAQSAAETAERAAQAARAAANLAHVRISELVTKKSMKASESCGNELPEEGLEQPNNSAKPVFHPQHSFSSTDNVTAYGQECKSESPTIASHVPQRLSSLEDDPYFSYPNLFTSKDSSLKSPTVHDSSDKTSD
ncbi:ENHANCER OF AG-4 protein 2-like [Canna indica]|uniref:ENHANCER OF AG-4 protein 2-like n=1 Tax=Canna indica TaxID=4628 RepID=A0AAQ3Q342_9LILI|nr:ENHANCER OF AG-4 protein 2-like [Canna indica]